MCDVNPLHSNSSIVVIGDLDHDVMQNINQLRQSIILIDVYDNHDEIYHAQSAMLNSDFKIFALNLCINKKTVMHLQQLNVAMVKMLLGKETRNKRHHMQSALVMKCVINLLTLMGNAGAIELHAPYSQRRLMHERSTENTLHGTSHVGSMRVSHEIQEIDKFDNLQSDYRHIGQNMMKNYQLYFTTYHRLHNLTFRQCYTSHREM